MSKEANQPRSTDDPLWAQPQVKEYLGGVSDMTLWRWRHVGILPDPIHIRKRNYWRKSTIVGVAEKLESAAA